MELLRSRGDQYPLLLELKERADIAQLAGHRLPVFDRWKHNSERRPHMIQPDEIRPQPAQAAPRRDASLPGAGSRPAATARTSTSSSSTTARSPVDLQVVLDAGVVSAKTRGQHHHRRLHQRGGRTGGVAGQGPGGGVEGARASPCTAPPTRNTIRCRRRSTRWRRCARSGICASRSQYLRRRLPRAQRAGRRHPQILPGSRLPLRAHAGDLGVGCRGRGQHVPGHHARSGRARQSGKPGFHAGFLRQAAPT